MSRFAMLNLWKKYKQDKAAGKAAPGETCRRGSKPRDLTALKEKLRDVPLKLRTTQRSVAAAIGLPRSTFARNMDRLGLKAWTKGGLALTELEEVAREEAGGR